MTFRAPTDCNRRGDEASIYIDMTFGGRIAPPTGSGPSEEILLTDLDTIYTALEAALQGNAPTFPVTPMFCLLETVQGDLNVNDAGNSSEKQIRNRLRRTGSSSSLTFSQERIAYKGYVPNKRDMEVSFDMGIDATYPGNEVIKLAGNAGYPLCLLITSGFIEIGPQVGWYGDFLLDTDNSTFPYEGDSLASITLRPRACTHLQATRVRTEFDTTTVELFEADEHPLGTNTTDENNITVAAAPFSTSPNIVEEPNAPQSGNPIRVQGSEDEAKKRRSSGVKSCKS